LILRFEIITKKLVIYVNLASFLYIIRNLFGYNCATYCINLTIAYAHRTKSDQITAFLIHLLYLLVSFQSLAANMYHNQDMINTNVNAVPTIYAAANIESCTIDSAEYLGCSSSTHIIFSYWRQFFHILVRQSFHKSIPISFSAANDKLHNAKPYIAINSQRNPDNIFFIIMQIFIKIYKLIIIIML